MVETLLVALGAGVISAVVTHYLALRRTKEEDRFKRWSSLRYAALTELCERLPRVEDAYKKMWEVKDYFIYNSPSENQNVIAGFATFCRARQYAWTDDLFKLLTDLVQLRDRVSRDCCSALVTAVFEIRLRNGDDERVFDAKVAAACSNILDAAKHELQHYCEAIPDTCQRLLQT